MDSEVIPTRNELLRIKNQLKFVATGHKLLKKKRDGLIMEFFKLYKEAKNLRKELSDAYSAAQQTMDIARVIESDLSLRSVSLAVKEMDKLDIEQKNIMGISVLNIRAPKVRKQFLERGYGVFNSTSLIEASLKYEELIEKVIKVAEVETSLRKMLIEIEKTKRRVNALEFRVMPSLEQNKSFVSLRLEEIEREGIFQMKKIKQRS
ncbi:V-type ATP synthase subunit D [Candidatus Woesearchaeota archaeon]|nr:V-type ATP synthase subunit D [Candidatus Woesearchaeota archaeon]